MEKIPYTLAAVRMDKIIADCLEDMKKIPMDKFSKAVAHEMGTVRGSMATLAQHHLYRNDQDREPVIESTRLAVYNACAMFICLGSFEDVKDRHEELDSIEATYYALKKFLEEYPPKNFEPRWFSCNMCGKECQLYVLKKDREWVPWNEEEDMPAVKEFMNISHICDKCWQHYIYRGA